ncbi:methyltransferase domain-containing protein [Granulicella arctica]|uniref:methyltransferase domain-containing protein n=1 Tax=Granulicella arctica TaxID=940613 RepID=UPI0021E0FB11|nr:methyltransferase domain-containing protein [Granulicella arctica]
MSTRPAAPGSIFDQWAEVYDTQSNPLLMLEERTAPSLLPPIKDNNILDVGCGTGRWLVRLEALAPHSLTGTDCSTTMLEQARRKLSQATVLHESEATNLPGSTNSYDLILASFVLSYVDDLPAFACECARTLRPGGHILLSDMHPATAAERGWTRSFRTAETTINIPAHCRTLTEIIATFTNHSFELSTLTEPAFGPPERPTFEQAGKLTDYESLTNTPAIYLLKLLYSPTVPGAPPATSREHVPVSSRTQITNARWSVNATTWNHHPLTIDGNQIAPANSRHDDTLDLAGYVLLPGLINAHDHLEFALFPNLGRSPNAPAYSNSAEWANEIHNVHAATINLHRQIPLATRLWWGALRNLLCGVTTVCHHNPFHPELTHPDFLVRVLTDFGWAHSLSFERNVTARFESTPADRPFILHAGEGIGHPSREELDELNRLHLLSRNTVLVHGLAFTESDIALLNQRSVSLVLCPTSNLFLFAQSPSNALITSIEHAALGSDSPLTAIGDLLDEIHHLQSQRLDPNLLYNLVTENPSAILHLHKGEGTILPGGRADLIAVRDTHQTPAQTIANLTLADVELVLLGGRVHAASPSLYKRLVPESRVGLHLLEISGHQRWVRAPLPALFEAAEQVLGKGNLRLGNKEVHHLPLS